MVMMPLAENGFGKGIELPPWMARVPSG